MKTLNLVYPEKSDIKYRIDKFPDGQQQFVVTTFGEWIGIEGDQEFESHFDGSPYGIETRLNNFIDLEVLICATKSLRNLGVKEIHLYSPYLLGARSDRKFEEGGNNYLKDVICPIINSLNFESVTVLDPHSDVLEACLNNFRKESNINLVNFALEKICNIGNEVRIFDYETFQKNIILVSPDAGASKKIYKIAEQIGYKGDIITCSKERDGEGKLTKCVVPKLKNDKKDIILIDDIGDGFGTFKNIAREIKKDNNFTGKLYLIVTHSIQHNGICSALTYFDAIYSTNSYKDFKIDKFYQLNIF